jgi:hypothetical protein
MVLGTVWWVLFWALVIWVAFKVAGGGSASGAAGNQPASPIEIARRRYAAGEITKVRGRSPYVSPPATSPPEDCVTGDTKLPANSTLE